MSEKIVQLNEEVRLLHIPLSSSSSKCGRMTFKMLVYMATVEGRWEPSRTQRGPQTSSTN